MFQRMKLLPIRPIYETRKARAHKGVYTYIYNAPNDVLEIKQMCNLDES
jgi:hypothetical protein